MTDREKVIEELERLSEWFFLQYQVVYDGDAPDYYDAYKTVDDALALLKEQEEEPNANGWISVKDRLPEKEGQYLCWFGKNTMTKGAVIATYLEMWKSFGSLESLVTYPNVTHWMPIESPEEVKLE